MADWFRRFAHHASYWVGTPYAFALAILSIVIWVVTGPTFHYSDTWQLIINTGTTIVTFMMVFLIQNTQNRDTREIHLKIDELIRAIKPARNKMLDLEKLSDAELDRLHEEFLRNQQETTEHINRMKEQINRRKTQKGRLSGTSVASSEAPVGI